MVIEGRSLFLMFTSACLLLLTPVVSFNPTGQRMPRLRMNNLPNRSVKKLFVATPMTPTIPPLVAATKPSLSGSDIVKGMMRTEFPRALETDTVSATMEAMRVADKGSVLIFNSEDKLSGIFTERDFVKKIIGSDLEEKTTLISTVMTPRSALTVANSETSIDDCRKMMVDSNIRHLPILNYVGDAVGIVSMRDIIRMSHYEDMCSVATFYGSTLNEVEEEAKDLANRLSLEAGEEGKNQDVLRSGFVLAAFVVGAGLLQGNWIHDHEWLAMCLVFLLGYVGIVFENLFEFNKAAVALLMSTALWDIYASTAGTTGALSSLSEKVAEVSEVVFFLLGAMTIVEIVDSHQGFKVVTDVITSKKKKSLMWVIGLITFFMSAILDNLTTTIVMVSLVKKILPDQEDRKLFGAMIVIAANAGGAWTPIGDVTTTMLWINGQISALPTITGLFFPSIVSVILSVGALATQVPTDALVPPKLTAGTELAPRGQLVFITGILGLLSVPAFKAITGLPPYLGMLSALGVLWSLTDAIHAGEGKDREELLAPAALKKIDTSGVLFFLGILLSVGAMDSAGILRNLAEVLDQNISNDAVVATLIGVFSAIIDNVPLVAATMGMYPVATLPMDSPLWQLIAFCAGTGGSLLVIGSAAGVALMGLEKVDFVWYAKRVSLSALLGYAGGIGTYLAQQQLASYLSPEVVDTSIATVASVTSLF